MQVWSVLTAQATLLGELDADGQELLVAKGGCGGRGNAAARSTQHQPASRSSSIGSPGQEVLLLLQQRLLADVALVGLPNVGKSSLIASLTHARAQVTSQPRLVRCFVPSHSMHMIMQLHAQLWHVVAC